MQEHRPFEVISPLSGPNELILYRMRGKEELGRLFTYELEMLSESHSIDISEVLGQHMSVRANIRNGGTRYFDGVVSRFSYEGHQGKYARYTATLRPWLWFLTRTADCRIFQEKTSLEIIKSILDDAGLTDSDLTKASAPPVRDYCVQYRETDFNFISRLLEDNGIYYYFTHEEKKHKLILADGVGCHTTQPSYESMQFYPEGSSSPGDEDRLHEWYVTQELKTCNYAHTDYDFTNPKSPLETKATVSRDHPESGMEVFDYPGRYVETTPGEDAAAIRIEELQTEFETMHGSGSMRGLSVGDIFALTEHPRDGLNRNYLITAAEYELVNPEYESGRGGSTAPTFHSSITAIEDKNQFRPARSTRKPVVEGPQTATVTGSGEDPWTDEYGRIKVHFHWDRNGKTNEESSCFVRVSQASAGKNWGSMFLPHPGHEVIIDFLEGDPDQPIATGCVYNFDNKPPKTLPDQMHVSMIRDKFGNQLAFDATPGSEHIRLYSPSKQSALVLGQSMLDVTQSGKRSIVLGNKYSHYRGNSSRFTYGHAFSYQNGTSVAITNASSLAVGVGAAVSGYLGAKFNLFAGVDFSISYATKFAFGSSRSVTMTSGEYARVSESDIKHDSEKEVWLAGGKNDESIVKASKEELLLQFGSGPDRPSVKNIKIPAALGVVGALVAAGGTYLSSSEQVADATEATSWEKNVDTDAVSEKLDEDSLHSSAQGDAGTAIGVLMALWGAARGVAGSDVSDPSHTTYKGRLKIDDSGIFVGTGDKKNMKDKIKGVKLNANDKAIALISDKGQIELHADQNILLICKKKIQLQQKVVCSETGEWKKKLWNPNFSSDA